jgi:DNA-binding transcriptional LysR family regulator
VKNATLRQLKVFESVARLNSFSRAAEELHLTQPAVSTQIKKLEEHAGNRLFEQFGKKIYLTPAGTELLEIGRAIIGQFDAAAQAMAQFSGVAGGRLNVGVISAGDYFFPRLLVEFVRRHRDVSLDFSVHNREGLLGQISHNLTDLAIMVRPPTDMDTVQLPFAPHPYVIVAPATHPLLGECSISRARIVREPFIVLAVHLSPFQSFFSHLTTTLNPTSFHPPLPAHLFLPFLSFPISNHTSHIFPSIP